MFENCEKVIEGKMDQKSSVCLDASDKQFATAAVQTKP